MTKINTIDVYDIADDDHRAAGWWSSADSQSEIDMTGTTLASAKAELLDSCGGGEDGERERHAILAGRIQVLDEDTTGTSSLTGWQAIDRAEAEGLTLSKFADPVEDEAEGLTPAQAREIAREDPSLIFLDEDELS